MNSSEELGSPALSPAAKAALDDAIREIRQEICLRAMTIANRGADEESVISVLDVAAALEQKSRTEREQSFLTRTLTGATFLYGIIGASLLIYLSVTDSASIQPIPLLAAMCSGAAVPGIAFRLSKLLRIPPFGRRKGSDVRGKEMLEILQIWLEVESAIRSTYGRQYGESRASAPVSYMLRNLEKAGDLNPDTIQAIERLRSARNSIAHARAHNISKRDFEELRRGANRALSELQRVSLRRKERKSL
ncbi:hypothetical protein [Streptomyces sp. NPDC058202]|uniref:hypothetical protein n=1 Tax=Streptomyces sp. NPDC058202 TaxID=3346380 RepID=UPI0036E7A541